MSKITVEEILKKVRKLEIVAKKLSNELFAGDYQSAFKGRGMSFSEVRDYQSGDEIRTIDWNVTARFNTPFVKVFDEEREMTLMLVIDCSASGSIGAGEKGKKEYITEIAAVIAYSALQNKDKIGLLLFTDKVEKFIPPKKGKSHILHIIREIVAFEPTGSKTNISKGLDQLNKFVKNKATVLLLSDFIAPPFEDSLRYTSKKHDLVSVCVSDTLEHTIPNCGLLPVMDKETGRMFWLDTSNKKIMQQYADHYTKHIENITQVFRKHQVDCVVVSTETDYVKPLHALFKKRGKKR